MPLTGVDVEDLAEQRLLAIPRSWNFRDLGGYPTSDGRVVRWHTLFRADGIHRLDADGHAAVSELGVRTVVDLRSPRERTEQGAFPSDRAGIAVHHHPVLAATWMEESLPADGPADELLAQRYLTMVTDGGQHVAATLQLVADRDRLPLVFHCAAGKDRTGVTAALLLALIGVDDATIARDYALSRVGVERFLAWLRANRPEALDAMTDQPAAYLASPPAAMLQLLDGVRRRWGSIEGWADEHGVDRGVRRRLRRNLLV